MFLPPNRQLLFGTGATPSTLALDNVSQYDDTSPFFMGPPPPLPGASPAKTGNDYQQHNQLHQPYRGTNIAQTGNHGGGGAVDLPSRTAVVPPLNLSMESLTPYADEDITVTSGYDPRTGALSPLAGGGGGSAHLPLINIQPESAGRPSAQRATHRSSPDTAGDEVSPPERMRR